ncbi:MAG: hypothetical protein K6G65_09660 [Lachnospiraceae bacterium]|nr:hypothetical protein [Lachnospiraceae bacterium]
MANKFFSKALADFVQDAAINDAIRHLADKGYTLEEIRKQLDFTVDSATVQKVVWKRYIETGRILEKEPCKAKTTKVSYVKEYGEYGKATFRRVVEEVETSEKEYLACPFGLWKRNNPENYMQKLMALLPKDKEYVDGLPWPEYMVYHEADERMKRIIKMLEEAGNEI